LNRPVSRARASAAAAGDSLRFLVRGPGRPGAIAPTPPERRTGVDFETDWARRYPVRLVRAVLTDNVSSPVTRLLCSPTIEGVDQLDRVEGPAIFTANHASHLDTALLLSCLPAKVRHRTVVAAAADYFFDRRWKAALWAFSLNSIPMERVKVNRKSGDIAAALIEDGWNLLVFPEGGRSPDGWGQEFRGGAAYLSRRCDVPVIPVHISGSRAILAKGSGELRPGSTEVRFGRPLRPGVGVDGREEDARRFALRVEKAVSELADEAETDWWSARRRAAAGATPSLRGPEISPWRRSWALPEAAGGRRRVAPISGERWPWARKDR
jgi:1-acyl-sn-glycerol-3-phosphate acyltransferase